MSDTALARALDYQRTVAYHPAIRPGYVAWVSLFQYGNGDLGMACMEIRKGTNARFQPVPLEFLEAMAIPSRVGPDLLPCMNKDLLTEYPCFKSSDNGATWTETGRSDALTRHHWHAGFPDGRIVRAIATQHYRYEVGDDRLCNIIEESTDGGTTWKPIARFMEGYFFYLHKFKKLRDGSLVAAGIVKKSFGPGGERLQRHTLEDEAVHDLNPCFMFSPDGGYTWNGPHSILPGVTAWEPDFVELPSGDLLFINSTVQTGRATRQYVRRTAQGFIAEPLLAINRGAPADPADLQGGITPESVVMTDDGVIIGSRRGGPYTCSIDEGENWYEIDRADTAQYQPMIELLPDGRVINAAHIGGDSRLGEFDMNISMDTFTLEQKIPRPTRLTLERNLSEDKSQYINAFSARLTKEGKPMSSQNVRLCVSPTRLDNDKVNPHDVTDTTDIRHAVTNEQGVAVFVLKDRDEIPDLHASCRFKALFTPDEDESITACASATYICYAITPSRTDPANYPLYTNRNLIMITPPTAERFPDLGEVLARLDPYHPDVTMSKWIQAAGGDETRAGEIVAFLEETHLIKRDDAGIYQWYRSVDCTEKVIDEVRVCNLQEFCV